MSDQGFEDVLRQMQDGAQPRLGVLAAQIVQFMKDKGVTTEEAIQQLQAEIEKREPLVEELYRLAAMRNPDAATLKRMEEIAEEASQKRWFK